MTTTIIMDIPPLNPEKLIIKLEQKNISEEV